MYVLGGLMRMIPVSNSQSDLAEVSELIKVVRFKKYLFYLVRNC